MHFYAICLYHIRLQTVLAIVMVALGVAQVTSRSVSGDAAYPVLHPMLHDVLIARLWSALQPPTFWLVPSAMAHGSAALTVIGDYVSARTKTHASMGGRFVWASWMQHRELQCTYGRRCRAQ